jgi:hypothetical protein
LISALSTIVVLLALTLPAGGQDFQAGLDAYSGGDYATALREWKPLAEQGHAKAQYNLGILYSIGRGVLQNYAEALKWYRLAAEQGYADAQYNLGLMYENGTAVAQDYVQAHMWFNLAAARGTSPGAEIAAENRDIAATSMSPAQIAVAQRLAREWLEAHEPE